MMSAPAVVVSSAERLEENVVRGVVGVTALFLVKRIS
jgi:hypothetical protein